MYKKILIAIDNSGYSNSCIDLGIAISGKFNSLLVGCHVYDASLHQRRFRDMEKGLPPQYQDETTLKRQRELHTSLINLGLKLISESYLDVFKNKCIEAHVPHERLLLEGKNYDRLIKEVDKGGYDLIIIGALGLAAVNEGVIGSVCERVVRRVKTDVLVVRNKRLDGRALIAVDGSAQSVAGVSAAVNFAHAFNIGLDAVSVFDPHYHRVAFESIAKVLSKEAGQVFRFREQETLHEEIIDKGLAKIYQTHLDNAVNMAKDAGVVINTTLMDGKPYDQILKCISELKPSLLILGRTGVHNTNGLDIGSTTENLLRLSPCNLLLTGGNVGAGIEMSKVYSGFQRTTIEEGARGINACEASVNKNSLSSPMENGWKRCEETAIKDAGFITWTQEAQKLSERIPVFIRDVVRKKIEEYACENGLREITPAVVNEAKTRLMNDSLMHSSVKP